jgi:hypothetical protein
MRGVVRNCIDFGGPLDRDTLRDRQARWTAEARATFSDAWCNTARLPIGKARPLGADNATVIAEHCSRTTIIAGSA